MKTKLFFSWIALLLGALYGANLSYSGQISPDPLAAALSWGYIFWALYWGVPVVWRWWQRSSFRNRGRSDFWGRALRFVLGFFVVLIGGYLYGFFGGGIYQFLRTWWTTRSRA